MKIKKKNVCFKVLSVSLAFLTTAVMVLSLSSTVNASNGDRGSEDLQVDYHTKTEIANYIKNHPDSDAYQVNYDANPVITPPYALGKISDSSLNGTITLFNTFRYIAGIPANVTLNDEYNELAQSAALVNAANNKMSHNPTQPSGMSDEMYQKGKKGAGSSNIGWGYRSLGSALKTGWMSDADSGNIDRIGHRRWVLNPSMGQTGFGYAGSHSAMYAFDSSNSEGKNYKGVAWPAQNTPVGYFPSNDPWSISLDDYVDSATVTLTCVNTGNSWVFYGTPDCKKTTDAGYININNDGYGQSGCIIFRPASGTNVSKGYSYNVSITCEKCEMGWVVSKKEGNTTYYSWGKTGNVETFNINYTVDFFDIEDYTGQSTNNNNENPDNPSNNNQNNSANEEQVKEFVKRFYVTILQRPYDDKGLSDWANVLLSKKMTATDVAYGFVFSDEFKDKNYSPEEYVERLYSAFFNREAANDPDGANLWISSLKQGKSREYVFAGFVGSDEFKNLCASYGIEAGEYIPNEDNSNNQTQQQQENPQPTQSGIRIDASGVDPAKLDEFMERLYNEALGRPSDPQGKQDWANAILSGQYDAGTVARYGFFASEEYISKNKTPEEFVHDAYRAFFGRDEDQGGFDMWVNGLKDGTYTRDQVIEKGFGYSDEFIALLESYGFKVYR